MNLAKFAVYHFDDGITYKTKANPVADAVRQGNPDDNQKCGKSHFKAVPRDITNDAHHEKSHHNQGPCCNRIHVKVTGGNLGARTNKQAILLGIGNDVSAADHLMMGKRAASESHATTVNPVSALGHTDAIQMVVMELVRKAACQAAMESTASMFLMPAPYHSYQRTRLPANRYHGYGVKKSIALGQRVLKSAGVNTWRTA